MLTVKKNLENSHFLWPVYCIKAGKSHASAVEHLFLSLPPPFFHLSFFFSCWLNALKSERLWHCFDRPTSEIPSVEEIKGVWCPALTAEVQMSLFLSTSTYSHGVGEKRSHIELLVLSFRPSLGGYRLWQSFIFAPMRLQGCAWESLWESVRQCENQMGIQTPLVFLPSPDSALQGILNSHIKSAPTRRKWLKQFLLQENYTRRMKCLLKRGTE